MLGLVDRVTASPFAMRVLNPFFGRLNPFLPSYRRDPYPVLHALRAERPVYRHPVFRAWILTRYDDVEHVLRAPHYSVDRTQTPMFRALDPFGKLHPDFAQAITRALLMIDPPDHTRIRRLVNKAFTPGAVEKLRPRIETIVDELVAGLEVKREFDLMEDFAVPLPVTAICELLGVPADGRANMKRWSDALAILVDPFQATAGLGGAQRAFLELADYFRGLFDERRKAPRNDLISALVAAEEEGDRLTEIELLSLTALLMGAGHETTTNLIGNSVLALLQHPAEIEKLRGDPALAANAVEELLRFDSPVQITDRIATQDCEIASVPIEKGAIVGVFLGAANRDPDRYPDPDRLDLARDGVRNLAFGSGPHHCVGANLARLEAQVALPRLFERLPGLRGDLERVERQRSVVLRGPVALPLSC